MTGIGLQDFPWVILLSNKYTEGLDCHTNDLSGIVDPGQGLVGGDHGHQVGQRTESVVPTLGSVLLLKVIENLLTNFLSCYLRRKDKGHNKGVDIVDSALEEHQSSDCCKSLLLALEHELPTGAANKSFVINCCNFAVSLHFLLDDPIAKVTDKYSHSTTYKSEGGAELHSCAVSEYEEDIRFERGEQTLGERLGCY